MDSILAIEFIHKDMYEAKCRRTSEENINGDRRGIVWKFSYGEKY